MSPIENMWHEVKGTWPVLPPRNIDVFSPLISDAGDEVAPLQHFLQSLVESVVRQIQSVVEAQGLWASCQRGHFLEAACLKANILIPILFT